MPSYMLCKTENKKISSAEQHIEQKGRYLTEPTPYESAVSMPLYAKTDFLGVFNTMFIS